MKERWVDGWTKEGWMKGYMVICILELTVEDSFYQYHTSTAALTLHKLLVCSKWLSFRLSERKAVWEYGQVLHQFDVYK